MMNIIAMLKRRSVTKFSSDNIYFTIEEAIEEIKKRRLDDILVKKVDEYKKGFNLSFFNSEDKICLNMFRSVFTRDLELERLVEISNKYGLKRVLTEYSEDLFVAKNYDKFSLAKMYFDLGRDKNNDVIKKHINIIDFNDSEKKMISDIKTNWGQGFVDFHKELISQKYSEVNSEYYDISDWLHENGPDAAHYYEKYLTFFIKDAILFENYIPEDPAEKDFCENKLAPAYKKIVKEFGVKPIIVRVLSEKEEDHFSNNDLWLYDEDEYNFVLNKQKNSMI